MRHLHSLCSMWISTIASARSLVPSDSISMTWYGGFKVPKLRPATSTVHITHLGLLTYALSYIDIAVKCNMARLQICIGSCEQYHLMWSPVLNNNVCNRQSDDGITALLRALNVTLRAWNAPCSNAEIYVTAVVGCEAVEHDEQGKKVFIGEVYIDELKVCAYKIMGREDEENESDKHEELCNEDTDVDQDEENKNDEEWLVPTCHRT